MRLLRISAATWHRVRLPFPTSTPSVPW
jgi:hypothetical protein